MIGLLGRLSEKVNGMTSAVRCAVLVGCLLIATLVGGFVAYSQSGAVGVQAALIAASVCGSSAVVALLLALAWHGTPNGVAGALAGSIVGMGVPLAVAAVMQRRGGELVEAGLFGWIVVYYLTALVVKTVLVAPSSAKSAGSRTIAAKSGPASGAGA